MRQSEKSSVLGTVVFAHAFESRKITPSHARKIIVLLSTSVALMMTGYGIVMPVFARRLGEFGDGVRELGFMTMAFALGQLVGAPIWGSIADRRGRRPIILLAQLAVTLSYVGYLLATNTVFFIAVRAAAGFLAAGLFPSAMGVVADIIPEDERARWVGIVMGSYAIGMIFGPALGGFLYDTWGYAAPFVVSAFVALMALIASFIKVPETNRLELRWRAQLRARRDGVMTIQEKSSLLAVLPRPLYIFGTLVIIDFIGSFGFAFVEPQMIFYFYDTLLWTTLQFGIVVGVYGVMMVLGEMLLGHLSDNWGRKPMILLGLFLSLFLYIGLAMLSDYDLMILVAALSGFGNAILAPAISAFYLDITPEEHRSRIIGIKEASLALGGVMGPLAIAAIAQYTTPQGIFWIASVLGLFSLLLALLLREPKHTKLDDLGLQEEIAIQRTLAAQASLRGIVMQAYTARRPGPNKLS